jgi:hypothetical protein
MLKFVYKFDSLQHTTANKQRVRDVLSAASATNSLVTRDESGCVVAVVHLPSFIEFMALEMAFRTAGHRQ